MANICIACESSTIDAGNSLADTVRDFSHSVHVAPRDRYPVADAMTHYLGVMERGFDATFVVISTSNEASGWILKELRLRHLYSKCFPVLDEGVMVPASWPDDIPIYRLADLNEETVSDLLRQCLGGKGR